MSVVAPHASECTLPRPFLILQLRPEHAVADDEFRAILRHAGLGVHEVERQRVHVHGPEMVDPTTYAGIIVGGSPFDLSPPESAKTEAQRRVEARFMELLEVVVAHDMPFLGACSGNGLLGQFCGTPVTTAFAEPVGGVDVTLTEAGRRDPLLEGCPDTFRVLVGHKEACDQTPAGAVLLASSATCPVQMFRLGQNVYATQFHPEGDAGGFAVRIEAYRHHGYFPAEEAQQLTERIARERTPHAHRILRRFAERYRDG